MQVSKLIKHPFLWIGLIVIGSFLIYSAAFYPSIISDHALNILMANKYSLPETVYCWNQDRGGTFIPLISQLFIKGMGMSAIYAVSLTNYLLLTFGFLGFGRLFKHKELLIPFALIWFFPYQRFIDITSYPIGMSYCLLGISLHFILSIDLKKHLLKNGSNLLKILLVGIVWFCAVWVSDLMYISLLTIGLTSIFYLRFNQNKIEFNYRIAILCFVVILSAIGLIIMKLKTFATGVTERFASINTISEFFKGFKIVGQSIYTSLFEESLFISIGAWIILVFLIVAFVYVICHIKSFLFFKNYWLNLFLIDFVAILLVIFVSHWVFLNDYGRWYFVAPYISGSIFIFLLIDQKTLFGFSYTKTTFILSASLLLVGISTIEAIVNTEGTFKSEYAIVEELDQLGEIGIIGDYWSSYKLSIVDPNKVISTAHEFGGVRNIELAFEALSQPKLFLVKDSWLETYPDSLTQFQFLLTKKGTPFVLANVNLCEYKISKEVVVTSDQISYNENGRMQPDKTIVFNNQNFINQHAIYGPYIPLIKGKYKVEFYLTDFNDEVFNESLIADVVANHGNDLLALTALNEKHFDAQKKCFVVEFDVRKTLNQAAEFRIYVSKPVNFTFHKLVVRKLE